MVRSCAHYNETAGGGQTFAGKERSKFSPSVHKIVANVTYGCQNDFGNILEICSQSNRQVGRL